MEKNMCCRCKYWSYFTKYAGRCSKLSYDVNEGNARSIAIIEERGDYTHKHFILVAHDFSCVFFEK